MYSRTTMFPAGQTGCTSWLGCEVEGEGEVAGWFAELLIPVVVATGRPGW